MFGLFKKKESLLINVSEFPEYVYESIYKGIESIGASDARDIYALSFHIANENDDSHYPTLTFGFNTEENYHVNEKKASSSMEAKWNYAFWLQNEIKTINDSNDKRGRELWNKLLEKENLLISDNEYIEYTDSMDEKTVIIENKFVDIVIDVSKKMHDKGIIKDIFSESIPIIIHDLEYKDSYIKSTIDANPESVVDEFVGCINE